jgi:hypothetical protein
MMAAISRKSEWRIVRIEHLIPTEYEVEKHLHAVKMLLREGHRKIALLIAPNEYPYSKFLSLVLRCDRSVKQAGGEFSVIQSNEDFLRTVRTTNLHKVIRFLGSEEELEKGDSPEE